MNCDITPDCDVVFWRSIDCDRDRPSASKSLVINHLAARHRTSAFLSGASVNRRVAGSNPARGANFLNNFANFGGQIVRLRRDCEMTVCSGAARDEAALFTWPIGVLGKHQRDNDLAA
jgi:hypothetical protein